MAAAREKVGFIFECGRDGPDYQVCKYLLERLNPNIEMVPRFMDNAERLLSECGPVASLLLDSGCGRVVVAWDLEPPWERSGKPCRHEDKERVFESLKDARVSIRLVIPLCIERELECWLMADRRALESVLNKFKPTHPLGRLREYRRPDSQIRRPKTELIKLFQRELGKRHKYVDHNHALLIARSIPDWTRLRRSDSFRRFAEKVARTTL